MRLLFIGVTPNAGLERVLLANNFSVEVLKTLPLTRPKKAPDLLLYSPSTVANLQNTQKLRALFPKSWVILLVKAQWLETAQEEILREKTHDDIWIREYWESTFFVGIQRMARYQHLIQDLTLSQEQLTRLKKEYDSVCQQSKQFVDRIEQDVALATNLQRALLPKSSPMIPGVSLTVKYHPASGRGGDYYDIFSFGDQKRYGVLLADSKSHGMAATLLSVLVKVRLEEMKDRFPDSKSFVDYINKEIQQLRQSEIASLSLLYGILDRTTLRFQFTSAGNLRPLLWRMGEGTIPPTSGNPPLGDIEQYQFRESVLQLKPSDLLLFYTDGLERPLTQGATTVENRMTGLLKGLAPEKDEALEIQNEVMSLVDRFLEDAPLEDDFTLIQLSIDDRALYIA